MSHPFCRVLDSVCAKHGQIKKRKRLVRLIDQATGKAHTFRLLTPPADLTADAVIVAAREGVSIGRTSPFGDNPDAALIGSDVLSGEVAESAMACIAMDAVSAEREVSKLVETEAVKA